MKIKRVLSVVMASGAIAAGLVLPATAAQAVLTNCSDARNGNGWRSYCNSGTGLQPAVAQCENRAGTAVTPRRGNWATAGQYSNAPCAAGETVVGGSMQRG